MTSDEVSNVSCCWFNKDVHINSVEEKFRRAQSHGWYSRALHRTPDAETTCPCGVCSYTAGKRFQFWPTEDFAAHVRELGPGWSLYFDFAKKAILGLFLFFILYLGVFAFYLAQSHIACRNVPMVGKNWLPGDRMVDMQPISRYMGSAGNIGPKVNNFFLGGYWSTPLIHVKAHNELNGLYHPIRPGVEETSGGPDIINVQTTLPWSGLYVRQIMKSHKKPIFARVQGDERYYFVFRDQSPSTGWWMLNKRHKDENATEIWHSNQASSDTPLSDVTWPPVYGSSMEVKSLRSDVEAFWSEEDHMMVRWNTSDVAPESWVVYIDTPRKENDPEFFARFLLRVHISVRNDSRRNAIDGVYIQEATDSSVFKKDATDSGPVLRLDSDRWVVNDGDNLYASDGNEMNFLRVHRFDQVERSTGEWSSTWCMYAKCETADASIDIYKCDQSSVSMGFSFPWVVFYHYICLIALILGIQWYRRQQNAIIDKIDLCSTTPDDFTVCVRGFPPEITEQGVKDYFLATLPDLQAQDIYAVNLLYDILSIQDAVSQLPKIHDQLYILDKKLVDREDQEASEMRRRKLMTLEEKLAMNLKSWKPRVTGALVVFRQVRTAYECAAYFYMQPLKHFLVKIDWLRHLLGISLQRRDSLINRRYYRGKLIEVKRAPDPSDIRFDNEGYSRCNKIARRLAIQALLWLLLGCCSAASYYFSLTSLASPEKMLLKVTASVVLVMSNSMFGIIVSSVTYFGIYSTVSREKSKEMFHIAIAQLINSLYIPLLVHYMIDIPNHVCSEDDVPELADAASEGCNVLLAPLCNIAEQFNKCHNWYHQAGIVNAVLFFFLSSVIVIPMLNILPLELCKKWIYRFMWSIQRRAGSTAALTVTQQELSVVYEGCNIHLPYRFANMMNVFFVAITFAPAFPLGLLLGSLTLLAVYWSDKFQLIFLAKNPPYAQAHAARKAVNMVPYLCIPLPLIMYKLLRTSVTSSATDMLDGSKFMFGGAVAVTITILCVNCSGHIMEIVYAYILRKKERKYFALDDYWEKRTDDDEPYEQAKRHFKTTYMECNPVYKMALLHEGTDSARGGLAMRWPYSDMERLDKMSETPKLASHVARSSVGDDRTIASHVARGSVDDGEIRIQMRSTNEYID